MSRPLVFATRNANKLVELRPLLPADLDVIDLDEAAHRLGRDIPDVVEDRATFLGNAEKKAREVSAATSMPALADDSGLEVDALGGAPGVYSARYAGDGAGAQANMDKLLAALDGVPAERRTARFRCVLALADVAGPLGEETITSEGTIEGTILETPRGTGGFGYDPLFLVADRGRTLAEMELEIKSGLSHRALAMHAIVSRLRAYIAALRATEPRG